jgi:predicted metal-dependent enzyme (double-stranded beta helix superfamily)
MAVRSNTASRRERACASLMEQVHAITATEGITPSTLHAMKLKLVALAKRAELFPRGDFAMPEAHARNFPLLVEEENDGYGLYLTISLPGKEAAPHDHGVWCVGAAISGQEQHRFFRRTDDGRKPGVATVTQIGQVLMRPGTGTAMADHDIHSTVVVGKEPSINLALYGYALARFPTVTWYTPDFSAVRTTPSRRHAA